MTEVALETLPRTDAPPVGAQRSQVRKKLVRSAFSRRAIMKGTLVALSASALSSVDGLLRLSGAYANPPTWSHCSDYVGKSWENGWWTQCNPYANDVDGNSVEIGPDFCRDGYHRNDTVYNQAGGGSTLQFERRPYSCIGGAEPGTGRNAWVWKVAHNPAAPNPDDRRCSDGKYRLNGGGWHYSVCQVFL